MPSEMNSEIYITDVPAGVFQPVPIARKTGLSWGNGREAIEFKVALGEIEITK